ncbi:hypothetical protein [Longimicrobium sp.]
MIIVADQTRFAPSVSRIEQIRAVPLERMNSPLEIREVRLRGL